MSTPKKRYCLSFAILFVVSLASAASAGEPARDAIEKGMSKATRFFVEHVSYRGGYVWAVSEDFQRRYGEIAARPSQIWVQGGTPMVGMVLLDAYEATGDALYLDAARRAADALIYGQHPGGGWHYFIDFDPSGIREWYASEASMYKWGMEEYRHYYGNCTFDDGTTADPAKFLLRYYRVTLDPAYRAPLLKALDFVLAAQYPNGSWPQRFPLNSEPLEDGRRNYTPYATLNDGVAEGNIELLVQAYEGLGDPRYMDAARKAVDFLIAVQGPKGEGAWAEQYGPDLKPVAARTHEPAGYVVRESLGVVRLLEMFFLMTGERKYLEPIPACFDWVDRVAAEAKVGGLPRARYYEPGTNRPIYVVNTAKVDDRGHGLYEWTSTPGGQYREAAPPFEDTKQLRQRFAEVSALSPREARARYESLRGVGRGGRRWRQRSATEVLASMDERGAWLDNEIQVLTKVPGGMNPGTHQPLRGYATMRFVMNLRALIGALTAPADSVAGRAEPARD